MCEALGELGIGIDQLHPESAPGQYEIATQHGEAMQVGLEQQGRRGRGCRWPTAVGCRARPELAASRLQGVMQAQGLLKALRAVRGISSCCI